MKAGAKISCLKELSFGNQVAEEERETLRAYFVKTQAWNRIYNGDIDIIYGPKGSGKSALYVLIRDHDDDLFDKRVLVIAAENPQGAPAFKDLERDPPPTEREFAGIWKLYFVSLLGRVVADFGIDNAASRELVSALKEHDLLPEKRTALGVVLKTVRRYVARMFRPSSIEGSATVDPSTGIPLVTGKIVFEEPDMAAQKAGTISVDELLSVANNAFDAAGYDVWLMLDRLDVAFDEASELEFNALRSLFRAYRDIRSFGRIKPKIFLRTDIWKRITEGGFREATHFSRDIHIQWDKPSLKNLIVRRLLNNKQVIDLYDVAVSNVLSSSDLQDQFFERVFPDQVEVGKKQSTTLDWLLRRTADGSHETQPRDLILFLNKLSEVQTKRIERGDIEPEGEYLFDRTAFKEAMPALSEYRVTKVIFAEYPRLRPYVDALREQKTEHTVSSLADLWALSIDETEVAAKELVDVGFFEERRVKGETTYWVPFVYRPYLAMTQGRSSGRYSEFDWFDLDDDVEDLTDETDKVGS
ncbi:hypothetical protein C3941_13685 [Kaistia algarum]|uniref:P-loop ATPase, Sll1717 family n=1 Tax=Kaistia algarum TaxID=2083279 RepID=UPI000CE82B5E|nr:hypothetical protein [Kaistia algarum]MCX5513733.1 hypothetical protein [Kaistia algarum]PPE79396.1 hypothetical protein C3941_13685 [Kaistia algarum]